MRRTLQGVALLAATLLVPGCGGEAPLEPGTAPAPRVDRGRRVEAAGPDFERPWRQLLPDEGFLYAAVADAEAVQALEDLLPVAGGPTSRAAPGLAAWLRRLRELSGSSRVLSRGAAVLLGAPTHGPVEHTPLDFALVAPTTPALEAALAKLGEGSGPFPAPGGGPALHVTRGPLVRLGSRPAWVTGEVGGLRWPGDALAKARRRASAIAVLAPRRYLDGPAGERTRVRNPAEHAHLLAWHGLFPAVVAEAEPFEGGLTVDLWAELAAEHPRRAEVQGLFPEGLALASPSRVPSICQAYLVAGLDWSRARSLVGGSQTGEAPSSPFDGSQGAARPTTGAPWRAAAVTVASALGAALDEWAGPEVAAAVTWDAKYPHLGLLLQNREPKKAALRIQEYRRSEAGEKLRFVDALVHGTRVRYTRIDGVDPRWLEPAYGFVGRNLALGTSREMLAHFLDDRAPKIEEEPAFGGLFARLGRDLRAALYLRPRVLLRLLEVAGEQGVADAPARAPLEALASRVQGAAAGLALVDRERLQLTLVLSRVPGEGVDSGAGGAPR